MASEDVKSAEAKPLAVEDEQPDTIWETVRGVIFALGLAAAMTISFTVLSAYEMAYTRVSCPQQHFAASTTEQQREKQNVAVGEKQENYVMSAVRAENSRMLAA